MNRLNLMVMSESGQRVDRMQISKIQTPVATPSWTPIPHHTFLDGVQSSLERSGMRVVEEMHSVAREGNRYFGMLQLQNGDNPADYSLVLGLRNSHDKSFPAGLVVGAGVFVCDNLSFSGEIRIARKHTTNINRDLPSLIQSAVGRLHDMRGFQDHRIASYKRTEISDAQAHDLLIQAIDAQVTTVTRIPEILKEWRTPRHPEFAQGRNVWRLMNAFTEIAKGTTIFERPRATQAMHALLDTVSGVAAQN